MNENAIISVVVPVYNVEKYLTECLESILSQSHIQFELILVDDGSEDNGGAICDRYARRDDRIRVIHKTNGGLSDARNKGIEFATGEYITFIDSDDMISENYLSDMLLCAQSKKVEIVQGKLTHNLDELGTKGERDIVYSSRDTVIHDYLMFRNLAGYACNKLYKRRLFKDLRYPVGKIQEDAWTTYKALFEAQGVAVIDQTTYFYRINNASIMNGRFREQRFDIMEVPKQIRSYLDMMDYGNDYAKELDYYSMRIGFKTYNDCLNSGESKRYNDKMVKLRDTIIALPRDKMWETKYKLMTELLSFSPSLYQLLILHQRRKGS